MSQKALKAYIAAPATVDTSPIRRFLEREGVGSEDAYSISAGTNLVEALIRRVRAAHFAIAVLNDDAGWTSYELGLCDALGKPVLVIVSPELSPPASIAAHPQVRTTIGDSDVWQLALAKFIREVRENRPRLSHRTSRSKSPKINLKRLTELAGTLQQERTTASPQRVEELALEILRAASVTVVAQEPALMDRGADFAVWDDSLAHAVGLPLFVELKVGSLDPDGLRQAEWSLANAMRASSGEWSLANSMRASPGRLGLLLYLDREGRRFFTPTWDTPFVVRFDIEDFARELTRMPFAQLIVEQRNKLVHGMG